MRGAAATKQHRPHLGVELCGVVGFDHAELQFMGRGRGIATVYWVAPDQLIAPDPRVGERPRNWATDTAGVILDDEFSKRRERHFRAVWIVPPASDDCSYLGFFDHAKRFSCPYIAISAPAVWF